MFHKSPGNLWNAVFNVFQGGTMTIAVSMFVGQATPGNLLRTFVCAYCAGVMLTAFLNVSGFGALIARLLHCDKRPVPAYLVSGAAGGALMGVFMNFFITFMSMGPVPEFLPAFFSTLPFSMLVSAISSCCWIKLADAIVGSVYGRKTE